MMYHVEVLLACMKLLASCRAIGRIGSRNDKAGAGYAGVNLAGMDIAGMNLTGMSPVGMDMSGMEIAGKNFGAVQTGWRRQLTG